MCQGGRAGSQRFPLRADDHVLPGHDFWRTKPGIVFRLRGPNPPRDHSEVISLPSGSCTWHTKLSTPKGCDYYATLTEELWHPSHHQGEPLTPTQSAIWNKVGLWHGQQRDATRQMARRLFLGHGELGIAPEAQPGRGAAGSRGPRDSVGPRQTPGDTPKRGGCVTAKDRHNTGRPGGGSTFPHPPRQFAGMNYIAGEF